MAFHAHLVDGTRLRRIAIGQHERGHVLYHFGAPANDGHLADATELMHRRQPANYRVVFYSDMSGQRRNVGHDHVAAEPNIVGDMRVSQDVII